VTLTSTPMSTSMSTPNSLQPSPDHIEVVAAMLPLLTEVVVMRPLLTMVAVIRGLTILTVTRVLTILTVIRVLATQQLLIAVVRLVRSPLPVVVA